MADVFDRAQEADASFRTLSIDAIRRLAAQRNAAESAFACAWCGEAIPEARRKAVPGCDLCVSCQEQKEHLKDCRHSPPDSDEECPS